MTDMAGKTKKLQQRVEDLERIVGSLAESTGRMLTTLGRVAPLLTAMDPEAMTRMLKILQDIATVGVITPRLTIVNSNNEPVVTLQSHKTGGGQIDILNSVASVICTLYANDAGDGAIAIANAAGRLAAGLSPHGESGRLDLISTAIEGKSVSFGL
jgi:hypothetical protein